MTASIFLERDEERFGGESLDGFLKNMTEMNLLLLILLSLDGFLILLSNLVKNLLLLAWICTSVAEGGL